MGKLKTSLLVLEILVCFALPVYMLLWGVLSMPLWIGVVQRGGNYALWHLFDTVAGCLGVIGLVWLLRFHLSADEGKQFRTKTIALLAMLGLVALWGGATDHFSSFGLDPFTVLSAGLPTLCTGHLLVLGFMRTRRKPTNNALQATCEGARA